MWPDLLGARRLSVPPQSGLIESVPHLPVLGARGEDRCLWIGTRHADPGQDVLMSAVVCPDVDDVQPRAAGGARCVESAGVPQLNQHAQWQPAPAAPSARNECREGRARVAARVRTQELARFQEERKCGLEVPPVSVPLGSVGRHEATRQTPSSRGRPSTARAQRSPAAPW